MVTLQKVNDYLDWLKRKIFLDSKADHAKNRVVRRGEVYKCNLGYGIGSELSKERPCVILQRDQANTHSPNVIIAPITHTSKNLPIVVPISNKYDDNGNLVLDGNVLLGNIVCVSKARLSNYISKLSKAEMKRVDEAIATSLDIKHYYNKERNKLNDQLEYIDKLKTKIRILELEIEDWKKQSEINNFVEK